MVRRLLFVGVLLLASLLGACQAPELPKMPELPTLPSLPDIPESLRDLPGLIGELGLPDLSQIPNLPQLKDLPGLQTPPGAIVYNGPTERRVDVGQRVPGTDFLLTAVTDSGAEFHIAGLRSIRSIGDSLDFDGNWPSSSGLDYNLRLRIYYLGSNYIRAAGVHRLVVRDVQPVQADVAVTDNTLKFPFTVSAQSGQSFPGMTLGYVGEADRGGEISGLPSGDYPYFKVGDSMSWKGYIRPNIAAEYNIRMLYYDANSARVGGVVTLALPNN
ncbi:MAG: hypothetical protein R3C14_48435 [Caldilineaceae bacterium]